MEPADIYAFIPLIAILGGFLVAITAILSGMKVRELKIRERIAMIEKGLVPPPEVDPAGFDRVMGRHDRGERRGRYAAGRHRRAGIMLIGVGLGLMAMPGPHVNGPGGFLAILGLGFIVSSLFEPSYESSRTQAPPAPPPPPSSE